MRFESPLEQWPGTLDFPDPFTGAHYRQWCKAQKAAEKAEDETGFYLIQWGVFYPFITLKLEGIPAANITPDGDALPLQVLVWVVNSAAQYMLEQTNPKELPAESETT